MRHRRVYVARAAVRLALISATVIAGLLATAAPAAAQSDIRQDFPFEGTPGEIPVGPDLTRCGGSPDFGPFFGSTAEAFSGDTFVGFHESLGPGSPAETFSFPIDGSTAAGEDYRYGFTARIAPINVNSGGWIASNQGANSGTFRVYAGATACGLGQLIGTVNLTWPGDNQWLAQQLEFTANGAYEHLTFQATGGLSSGNATYFGIDDAVAQLQKEFSPDQVSLGETSTLNFTIENVDGLPAQAGWSFTDNLPAGIKVASPNGTTDCTNGTVTAQLDGDSVTVSGDLEAGQASCTASVEVMATEVGTHLNNHENFSDLVGISPPPPEELTCTDPPDPETEDIVGVFVDCDFSEEPPANDFTIKQDWQSATNTVAYQTPVVGDLFGTGDPAIITGGNRAATGGDPLGGRLANDLHVYDGATGNLLHTITTPRYSWSSFAAAAIADVDEDGRGEIIFRAASHSQTQADANAAGVPTASDIAGRLVAYKYDPAGDDWDVMWVSNQRYDQGPSGGGNQARSGAAVSLADFNGDGNAEVYIGNEILNARTGARLTTGAATDPSGCQAIVANPGCFLAQTVAVDTDGDGDLELAAGEAVYDVQITNPSGQAGNTMTIAETADQSNPNVRDGVTAVADMDLDGAPEIVVSGNGTTTATTVLYVWDPATGAVEGLKTGAQMTQANGTSGGPPMIGDIDGDGRPEIVMVTTNRLRAFDFIPGATTPAAGLNEIWMIGVVDGSGGTSMSMFDFNSDGEQEIVYRDEQNIRIIDGGPTPPNVINRNLASFACASGTSVDMPVIADITGTGEARIVVNCGVTNNTTGAAVRAYETNSFAWANTRPVWNQQAYFVTHINDDLTVPATQFENWTVFNDPDQRCSDGANRPLNNFQVQVTDLDSETGCPVICVPPSLEVDKTSDPPSGAALEPGDTVTYTVTIENTSSDDVTDMDLTDDLTDVLDDATITSGPTVDPPPAGTAQINGNELAFNGTIPEGDTVTITYEATVKPRADLGDRHLGNSVIGEFSNCDGLTGVLRCTTEHPVSVRRTDLELEKTGDLVVDPGDPVSYTLTVTNNGPDDSTGSTVTDDLPAGLTNIQVPGNCQLQGPQVTCSVGPLDAGDDTDIVITADAPNTPATCFENQASVEADDDDPDPSNDDADPVRTCTTPAADLRLEKSSTPTVVSPGAQVTYTLTVTNEGPQDSSGSTVTDDLPAGLTNVQVPGNCQLQVSQVTCNVGPLANGDDTDIVITAVAPNTPATCFENDASVQADQAAPEEGDPDLDNNDASARSCTTPVADLRIEKTGPAQVDTGGQVVYTLTATNDGPQDSSGSIVTDDLPAGLTNVQVPGNCQLQAPQVTCTLGAIIAGDSTNIVITADAPNTPSTCFENTASVEADQVAPVEGDPDVGNNDSAPVQTCTRESDLELTKAVDPQVVDPGNQVTYTLTVTNHGPDDSPGSTVTDNLPAGLTNVQVPGNCQLQVSQVTCNVGPLANGDDTDIVITADAPNTPATCFSNDASVEGTSDPTSSNDDASARACTTPAADLELEKVAPATVDPGGQVTWTLTVTNNGPQQSSGATVTDTLPASITNVQVPQGCQLQGSQVTCDVGPLNPDDSTDIVITGTAPNTASDCFSNEALVEIDDDAPDEGDPNPDNNDASAETCTNEGADLEVSKTAGAGPHFAGDDVTYTITVTNHGPATAHDVHVDDDLPASLTLVSATPEQGTCGTTDPVSCDLGTIAPDDSVEIELIATIGSDQSGNSIDNTACAEATEPDSEADDNCVTEPIEVESEADIEVAKAAAAGPHFAGDNVTYTLTVTNNGPNDATGVEVTDDLPDTLTLVSATPEQGTCGNTDPLSCQLGAIANGGTVEIELIATIGSDQSGNEIENTACAVGAETDPDDSNDCDTEPIQIEPETDLQVTKTAGSGPYFPGDQATYTLTVTNNGPNDATDVQLADDLPGSLSFISATPEQGQCNASDPLECDLGAIPAGESVEIDLVATIGQDQSGNEIENTACVEGTQTDPDGSNNCGVATVEVTPPPEPSGKPKLKVNKRASTDEARPGEVISYRIVVRNKGRADARRVRVCDKLPNGQTVLSAPGADKSSDKRVCWKLKRLKAGAKRKFKVVTQVKLNTKAGGQKNKAIVNAANGRGSRDAAEVDVEPVGGPCPSFRAGLTRC